MKAQRRVLISRNIICEKEGISSVNESVYGALLICDGIIEDVVPILEFDSAEYPEYNLKDFGALYIMPGLIDLNVSLSEGCSTVTKQAVSGGVTTISASEPLSDKLFTHIAPIAAGPLSTPNTFGTKMHLNPLPKDLKSLLRTNKPVFVHPEVQTDCTLPLAVVDEEVNTQSDLPNVSNLEITASKFRLDSDEESAEDGETSQSESESEPEIVVHSCPDPVYKPDCKKRVSLPLAHNSETQELKLVSSPRHFSIQVNTQKRVPLQDLPFIAKGIHVQHAYSQHVRSFPEEWEIAAVNTILTQDPLCPVHFSNVSSAQALKVINKYKEKGCKVTSETSMPYLYFNQNDVKPGDTRYKLVPPIRDYSNYKQLWQMVKNLEVDCISSYHQPVPPPLKFIGEFSKAKNGVLSVGFTLQSVWTRLRLQIPKEEESFYISILSTLLSKNPAKILNLHTKGTIAKGKDADLVIWDPSAKSRVHSTFDKFPEMNPMLGEELYGAIHSTYLSGQLAFSETTLHPLGQVLTPTKS